jgi:hypothetical protein
MTGWQTNQWLTLKLLIGNFRNETLQTAFSSTDGWNHYRAGNDRVQLGADANIGRGAKKMDESG